jgi:hypothetical protein
MYSFMASNRGKHFTAGSENKMSQNHSFSLDGTEPLEHATYGWAPDLQSTIHPTDARASANHCQN